jgi:predicted metal-dependent peptidase
MNKIIDRAKVNLLLAHPFFSVLALRMRYEETDAIPTASTDGVTIRYNPDFVGKLSLSAAVGLICHEVLHVGLLHPFRRAWRDPHLWNNACDYAVNGVLRAATNPSIELPEGALYDARFEKMCAEEIYSILERENAGNGGKSAQNGTPSGGGNGAPRNGQGQGQPDPNGKGGGKPEGYGDGWGNVTDPVAAATADQMREAEQNARQMVIAAANAAKQAGKLPAGMERTVDEAIKPVVRWRDVLRVFLSELAHNDYTWRYPNQRYIGTGLYLPSLRNEEMGAVVLAVDTSGSIDADAINQFASEIQDILSFSKLPVKVIYCDSAVAGVQELQEGEPLKPKGGGGTDFRPVFKYIEREEIDCKALVYYTDGECWSFPSGEQDYPTIWAVTGYNRSFKPPFGEVININ